MTRIGSLSTLNLRPISASSVKHCSSQPPIRVSRSLRIKMVLPPNGNHSYLSMKMEPTFEPEEIFQAIMNSEPMVTEVH